jgi:RNA polymerase sigma factor (sigma-70 family)
VLASGRLHEMLLRIARAESHRRGAEQLVTGPELDDLAHQAADDAVLAIMTKLAQFRGESRFTTWAYKFVILEVSAKLGRHFWQRPAVTLAADDWERLPDRFAMRPDELAQQRDLIAAVRPAVEHELTERQRQVFVAIVVNQFPLDAVAAQLGSWARTVMRSTRRCSTPGVSRPTPAMWAANRRYTSRTSMSSSSWTTPRGPRRRCPGVAAHLLACGPCSEDYQGLLAAARADRD